MVLFIGRAEIDEILPFEEIPHYITITEYVHIFPESTPLTKRGLQDTEEIKERVRKRLGLDKFDILDIKFDVVFILNTPTSWEDSIQIIIDVLSTNEGRVSKEAEYKHHPDHIPIYTSLIDLWFRR